MGLLARLLTVSEKAARTKARKTARTAARRYGTARRIAAAVLSGGNPGSRGTRKRTIVKEYRHGSCPTRHRSRAAAQRCRHP
jgi:hypothetical protein